MKDFNELLDNCFGLCGACGNMTTGNSMCVVAEALGMSMTGNSSLSGVSPKAASDGLQGRKANHIPY